MNLSELPTDIYFEIFTSYSKQELCNCMLVCKRLKETLQSNVLWKKFTEDHHRLTTDSSYTNYRANKTIINYFNKIANYDIYGNYRVPSFIYLSNNPQLVLTGKWLSIQSIHLESIPDEIFILDNIERVVINISDDNNLKGFNRLKNLKNILAIEIPRNNFNTVSYVQDHLNHIAIELSEIKTLTKLSITGNFLNELPDTFSNLINLEFLHLINNRFESFPIIICSLKNLSIINFSNNKISKLPDSFSNLVNLEFLDLSDNYFEEFPSIIFTLKSLLSINFSDNNIKELPKELAQMDNLFELKLETNNITVLKNIPKELAELDIYCNPIETVHDDCLDKLSCMVGFHCLSTYLKTDADKEKLNIIKQTVKANSGKS